MTDTTTPTPGASRREWTKVTHRPGGTFVTVTLMENGSTAKWTTKTYATQVEKGLNEAYGHAESALAELQAAVAAIHTNREKKAA